MTAATKTKIFEPFFSTKFTGHGLGLAAVLGIVGGHKGVTKIYSEPERGADIKLLFPCSEAKAMNPEPAPTPPTHWTGTGTILVIDDEASVRAITTRMLELFGFKVLLADGGREGVDIFRANKDTISVVILDMTMPDLSGGEVFREIRRIRGDAKVLLVSGYNEQDAIDQFALKGLAGFLQKPFSPVELRDKLRDILEK